MKQCQSHWKSQDNSWEGHRKAQNTSWSYIYKRAGSIKWMYIGHKLAISSQGGLEGLHSLIFEHSWSNVQFPPIWRQEYGK